MHEDKAQSYGIEFWNILLHIMVRALIDCMKLCLVVKFENMLSELEKIRRLKGTVPNKGRFCNTITSVAWLHTSIQSD